jgi:hypothetical protein
MTRPFHVLAALAAISLWSPASAAAKKPAPCGAGKVMVHGACVDACPTDGKFDPTTCECPKGYGKILTGTGAGECQRLACVTGGAIKNPELCDCPHGYEKKKDRKGATRCVLATAGAAERK